MEGRALELGQPLVPAASASRAAARWTHLRWVQGPFNNCCMLRGVTAGFDLHAKSWHLPAEDKRPRRCHLYGLSWHMFSRVHRLFGWRWLSEACTLLLLLGDPGLPEQPGIVQDRTG